MKTWWLGKGWPWLRSNWWVLLIFPLIVLVFFARTIRTPAVVVDPVAGADTRAREEAERRAKELEAEQERLAKELADTKARYAAAMVRFEIKLSESVPELRNNPDKLKELMLRVGRGET